MGWTLDEVRDLPIQYYEFLVGELTAEHERHR